MRKIAEKAAKEVKKPSEAEHQEDYYKGFRSAVVLVWIFCNFGLAAVVLNTAGLDRLTVTSSDTQRSTVYMAVVLWSVAGLSLFRFTGAVWFLIVRLVSAMFLSQGILDGLIYVTVPRSLRSHVHPLGVACGRKHMSVLCALCRFYLLDTLRLWYRMHALSGVI